MSQLAPLAGNKASFVQVNKKGSSVDNGVAWLGFAAGYGYSFSCVVAGAMATLLVAEIGEEDLILGYPFLEAANPIVNWIKGTIEGKVALISYADWNVLPEAKKKIWFHATLAKVTVAQQLAKQVIDKKEQTWQELFPKRYHHHGKCSLKKNRKGSPVDDTGIML